jgi:cell division protein FtsW (lipid II flippase)
MTTIPCFAAVAAAKGETPKGKFKWTLLFWIVTSFIVSSITYMILKWWWTAFIVVAVIVLVICVLNLWNKRYPLKGNK